MTSAASLLATAGSPFRHRIKVKPAGPGVTFILSDGPGGLLVSPDGTVTWTPPKGAAGEQARVVVTIVGPSGGERFHTLTIKVK